LTQHWLKKMFFYSYNIFLTKIGFQKQFEMEIKTVLEKLINKSLSSLHFKFL